MRNVPSVPEFQGVALDDGAVGLEGLGGGKQGQDVRYSTCRADI